jgi:hypothetical protein
VTASASPANQAVAITHTEFPTDPWRSTPGRSENATAFDGGVVSADIAVGLFGRDELQEKPDSACRGFAALGGLRGTRLVVQLLCDLLVVVGPLDGELGWGEVAVCDVGPAHVVVDAPGLDDDLDFEEAVELPADEEFVA